MPGFKDAFVQFQDNGCFKLQGVSIGFNELDLLRRYLRQHNFHHPNTFQFQLTQVRLLPSYHSELTLQENSTFTGGLTQEELPPSLQARPSEPLLQPDDQTFRLLSCIDGGRIRVGNIRETGQSLLLSLFELAHWEIIKLEHVVIVEGTQEHTFDFNFIARLYATLLPYATSIKALSLQHVELFNGIALAEFLEKASRLEILRVEDTNQSDHFVTGLGHGLVNHPTLRALDLGSSRLYEEAYQTLSALSYNNYHIEEIKLQTPDDPILQARHHELITRLQKPGFERFQDEHLTPENLYQIAVVALDSKSSPFFKLILNQGEQLAIGYGTNPVMPEKFLELLPEVLRRHSDYVKRCWPLQLDVHQRLEDQTVGASLFKKALQLENSQAMQLLLTAGVDLLKEMPNIRKQLFRNKILSTFDQMIIDHIIEKDLSAFVPFLSRLASYTGLDSGLKDIKLLLDQFLISLLKQNQLPYLLKLIKSIGFEAKKENWEKDFRCIVSAAKTGTQHDPVDYESLGGFEESVSLLLCEVEKDKQQWFRAYQFNKQLVIQLKELLRLTTLYKDLYQKWKEKKQEEVPENSQALQQWQARAETAEAQEKQSKEQIEQLKAEMKAREEQSKEQIEQLKTEMKEKEKVQEKQSKEQMEQLKTEMKEKAKVQEEKVQEQEKQIKEQGEKINKLTQLVEQLVACSPEGDRVSAEAAANEGDQSKQRFFKP
jgi:hypothetical protein